MTQMAESNRPGFKFRKNGESGGGQRDPSHAVANLGRRLSALLRDFLKEIPSLNASLKSKSSAFAV